MNHHETITQFFQANPDCSAIACEFSGCGDSGSIQEVRAVRFLDGGTYCDCDTHEAHPAKLTTEQEQAADELSYAVLEKQGCDWYNNEGGQGTVWLLRNGTAIADTEINIVESVNDTAEYPWNAPDAEPSDAPSPAQGA